MKKQLIIPGMAILLLAVALSGCTAPSNGFDSTSTFKLLSCLYYPDENKVLISINRSSSDSFTCWIVDSEGQIGYGYIDSVEQATYIELSKTVYSSETYGFIVGPSYKEAIFTAGLQFYEDGSVGIVDWKMPDYPDFRLISWEQTYDSGYHIALLVRYQYSDYVSFHILDSEGIEVGSKNFVGFTESKAMINFNYDTFDATFFNQTFKLMVTEGYFSGEIIYEEEIQLNNTVSLSIIDTEFNWEWRRPTYGWGSKERYYLNDFSFTIENDGDLPVYSGSSVFGDRLPNIGKNFHIAILDSELTFQIGHVLALLKVGSFGLIQPGEKVTVNAYPKDGISIDSPGDYDITVTLDYYDTSTSLTTTTAVG